METKFQYLQKNVCIYQYCLVNVWYQLIRVEGAPWTESIQLVREQAALDAFHLLPVCTKLCIIDVCVCVQGRGEKGSLF